MNEGMASTYKKLLGRLHVLRVGMVLRAPQTLTFPNRRADSRTQGWQDLCLSSQPLLALLTKLCPLPAVVLRDEHIPRAAMG